MAGRVVSNPEKFESWKSTIAGTIIVKKIGHDGKLEDEVVNGFKTFHITPEERRIYQERVAEDSLDVFQNGMLMPVKLIETSQDVEAIKNNPNHMTEEDMAGLFKVKSKDGFRAKVEVITNPITLNRLLAMAVAEETNATYQQVQIVQAAVDTHAPAPAYNEVKTISGPTGSM